MPRRSFDDQTDLEHRLDRDFSHEGAYRTARRRPPLTGRGTLRSLFGGVVQPPVKIGGGR